MANFEALLEAMDIDAYEELLGPEFTFFFLQGEGPSDSWDRTNDVASFRNLFSGDPPANPGNPTQNRGITSIEVGKMDVLEVWKSVSSADPHFGMVADAMWAVYTVQLIMMHDDGTTTLNNPQIFFAAPRAIELDDGTSKTKWELIGQRELPLDKSNPASSWGEVKTMFR